MSELRTRRGVAAAALAGLVVACGGGASTGSGATTGSGAAAGGGATGACAAGLQARTVGSVKQTEYPDNDKVSQWTMPAGLDLAVTGRREAGAVVVEATLRNTSAAPVEWVYLTGGEPGSTNPLHVRLPSQTFKPVPPQPRREVYPAPGRNELGPGAELHYQVTLCADDYASAWPGSMPVEWSLEAWAGQRKTGKLTL